MIGYICSSSWMKRGYKLRPQDFKRRILSRIYTTRKELLEEEFKWLSLIKEEELGKRYYNISKHHFSHWSTDKSKRLTVGEKISLKKKGKRCSPSTEFKKGQQPHPNSIATQFKKGSQGGIPWNKGKTTPEHVRLKQSLAKRGKRMSPATEFKKGENFIPWNKGKKTPEHVKLKQSLAKLGKHMSPATEFKKGHKRQNINR